MRSRKNQRITQRLRPRLSGATVQVNTTLDETAAIALDELVDRLSYFYERNVSRSEALRRAVTIANGQLGKIQYMSTVES